MEPGAISESVDHHDHAQYACIEADNGAEEALEDFFGAMTQLRQKFTVVCEIDAQHDRDGEDKRPLGHGIEGVVDNVLPGQNRFFWPMKSSGLRTASIFGSISRMC